MKKIDGILRLNKLNMEDCRRNKVIGVESTKLGGMGLRGSWEELTISLLILLYNVNAKTFLRKLYDSKVIDMNFDVTPDEYIKHTDDNIIKPMKVFGTPFFLYYDFSYKTLPFKVRSLFSLMGINPKDVRLSLEPYSYVEQDDIHYGLKQHIVTRMIRLSETANGVGMNNNKLSEVEIFGVRTPCRTYIELITIMLQYVSKLSPDWFNRVVKYNKGTVMKVSRSVEDVVLYEMEPREIPGTGCYVNKAMNADCVMEYLRDLCKEFCIDSNRIIFYCKDLDLRGLKTGGYIDTNNIMGGK